MQFEPHEVGGIRWNQVALNLLKRYCPAQLLTCDECSGPKLAGYVCDCELERRRESTCSDCGGEMSWCSICGEYTMTCCLEYGSCACC
jgi:hypothetical protein